MGSAGPAGAGWGGGAIVVPPGYYGGFYPWGYAGLGFGGYLGGYYGYYGDGGYDAAGGGGGSSSASGYEEGRLRLNVKPKKAEVYVDGAYAGLVDDFDSSWQALHLDAGPHHIEMRLAGYEPLAIDVRIEPGKKITYKGALKKN